MDIIDQLYQELNHLTLIKQAEVTGVTKSTLSRIWNRQLPPKMETIEKMANAVGLELSLRKAKRDKS